MGAGTLLALLLLKGWPAITVRWQPVTPELPALRDLADDESDKKEVDPPIRPSAHIITKAETLVGIVPECGADETGVVAAHLA